MMILTLYLLISSVFGGALEDACTAITVGRKATVDGSVISTHTNDCLNCDFRLAKIPAATHPKGSFRPVIPFRNTYPRFVGEFRGEVYKKENLEKTNIYGEPLYPWTDTVPAGYIPQVEQTYSYVENNYGIINEHQLAMGESTCGGKLVNKPVFAGGHALFDVSELTRIALERCKDARCAIKTMGSLAEEYGYYGAEWEGEGATGESGEALTISDPKEHWMFHIHPDDTGKSAVWAAQRIPDDHVAVVANQFVIRKLNLDDPDNFLASSNVVEVAKRNGFYNPEKDGAFDFTSAYALPRSHSIYATRRVWRVFTVFAPSLLGKLSPNTTSLADDYPISIKPDRLLTTEDVIQMQRDHYEGTPFDQTAGIAAGPYGNPNRYDPSPNGDLTSEEAQAGVFERSISIFRTTHSFVTQSRAWLPNLIGAKVNFATYAPHAACFTPVWVAPEYLPPSYTTGSLFSYNPKSSFWAHAAVGNYAERDFKHIIVDVQKKQLQIELESAKVQDTIEKQALEYLHDGQTEAALFALNTYAVEQANFVLEEWHKLLWILITKFHDGYRMDNLTAKDLNPTKIFYPKWWLDQVGFFKNAQVNAPLPSPAHTNTPVTPAVPVAPAAPVATTYREEIPTGIPHGIPAAHPPAHPPAARPSETTATPTVAASFTPNMEQSANSGLVLFSVGFGGMLLGMLLTYFWMQKSPRDSYDLIE